MGLFSGLNRIIYSTQCQVYSKHSVNRSYYYYHFDFASVATLFALGRVNITEGC